MSPFFCPSCGKAINQAEDYVGKRCRCPYCLEPFTILGTTLPATTVEPPPFISAAIEQPTIKIDPKPRTVTLQKQKAGMGADARRSRPRGLWAEEWLEIRRHGRRQALRQRRVQYLQGSRRYYVRIKPFSWITPEAIEQLEQHNRLDALWPDEYVDFGPEEGTRYAWKEGNEYRYSIERPIGRKLVE